MCPTAAARRWPRSTSSTPEHDPVVGLIGEVLGPPSPTPTPPGSRASPRDRPRAGPAHRGRQQWLLPGPGRRTSLTTSGPCWSRAPPRRGQRRARPGRSTRPAWSPRPGWLRRSGSCASTSSRNRTGSSRPHWPAWGGRWQPAEAVRLRACSCRPPLSGPALGSREPARSRTASAASQSAAPRLASAAGKTPSCSLMMCSRKIRIAAASRACEARVGPGTPTGPRPARPRRGGARLPQGPDVVRKLAGQDREAAPCSSTSVCGPSTRAIWRARSAIRAGRRRRWRPRTSPIRPTTRSCSRVQLVDRGQRLAAAVLTHVNPSRHRPGRTRTAMAPAATHRVPGQRPGATRAVRPHAAPGLRAPARRSPAGQPCPP